MATRRCLRSLIQHYNSFLSSNPSSSQTLKSLTPHLHHTRIHPHPFQSQIHFFTDLQADSNLHWAINRHFCTDQRNKYSENDDSGVESGDEEGVSGSSGFVKDKEKEAATIGYQVIGPLQESDLIFKSYEPVFAVVQVGSHQFKVSNGDSIYTEKLKYCDVNDKLILNKVLMLGSTTQTIVGRPILPDTAVHAVVEEHALDAKVIIFKKKRRKNYRRTKGHRQELTKLRITDIQGIERPENLSSGNSEMAVGKKAENAAVVA